jgi:uncharacterized protein
MDYPVISADDHIDLSNLPQDLWTARVPSRFKERAPHVEQRPSGPTWICDGESWGTWGPRRSAITGLIVQPGDARRQLVGAAVGGAGLATAMPSPFADGKIRPTDQKLRLEDMDRDGVQTTVMYGPITGLSVEDPELRRLCYQTYNDWLVEFCAYAPDRLVGVAQMPLDPAEAADELRRVATIGLKTANVLAAQAKPPLYHQEWEPFWDAAEETGVVVGFHVAAESIKGAAASTDQVRAASLLTRVGGPFQLIDPIGGLIAWGVLERRPGLKLVMAEAGLGWVPYIVQRWDNRYYQVLNDRGYWEANGGIQISMPPSEYFKRQVWVTYQDDEVGVELVKFFGEGHVMWASDYPHPDSTWPMSQQVIEGQLAHLDPQVKRGIVSDNARALYRI